MHHPSRRVVAASLASISALFALTACSNDTPPPTKPTPSASPLPSKVVVVPEDSSSDPFAATDEHDLNSAYGGVFATPIDRLGHDGDTDGTGAEVALRFLRALQDRDDLAAARTLDADTRLTLSFGSTAELRRVMSDVRKNAGLSNADKCETALQLNTDAAVVHCGEKRVVVHVIEGIYDGVQLEPRHVEGDVYPGPHTHAYTDIEI